MLSCETLNYEVKLIKPDLNQLQDNILISLIRSELAISLLT